MGSTGFTTLIFASCKDNDDATGDFDPNKPVVISEFSPRRRTWNPNALYGENFGSDISKIKVTIGGQDSKVVEQKEKASTVLCQLKLMRRY
ncbi:IPT/TIG domain-containing protein [Bacteroides thetaiotaomicron]|uniref:IPT/TIG domain-containing protein n=1 Tax=Bacteroides thetaiotaomicron TaxID=818 RepID=UPI001F5B4958|nr:IPT/TIG domain-containing protein [Bacteroides thetaiotaomicron]